MIRIGIVGSDNSHAESFSKVCNLKGQGGSRQIAGARVVALFGLDDKRNEEVARNARIPTIVKRPTDMLGMVDAVIVDFRDGALHYKYARPFLQAGLPTFVDKPMACSLTHARKIVALARRHRAPLMSASGVRFGPRIDEFKRKVGTIGKVRAGLVIGRGNARGPYGGIFFYGVHCVEMLLEIFGNRVNSVGCIEHDGSAVATVGFSDGKVVVMNVINGSNVPFQAAAFGSKGVIFPGPEDLFTGYYDTMCVFLKMVRTGKPPIPHKDLLLSVRIMDAMKKSMDRAGKEIVLR